MQCQKSNSINTIYSQAYWDIAVFVQAIEGHKLNLHNCTSYPDMEQMDLWESTFIQYRLQFSQHGRAQAMVGELLYYSFFKQWSKLYDYIAIKDSYTDSANVTLELPIKNVIPNNIVSGQRTTLGIYCTMYAICELL